MDKEQIADLAERWGFHLQSLEPRTSYPYETIRGFYRVPMFQAGLLECVDADVRPVCFKLTALGEAASNLAPTTSKG